MFFDQLKSFGIDSCCLYEIPKNDWVDDMKPCYRSRSPMCCYLIVMQYSENEGVEGIKGISLFIIHYCIGELER